MSLKTQVEAYTEALASSITANIKRSIAKVVALIPPDKLMPFTAKTVSSALGVDITDKRVIAADCGGYPAKEVLVSEAAKYSDVNSIYYASTRCPVYYQSGNKAYTLPAVGAVHMVNFSGVTEADNSITCIPSEYEEAVILDVAAGRLHEKLAVLKGFFTNASNISASATAIAALDALPTVTAPTLTVTGEPTAPSAMTLSASAPSTFTLSIARESADTGTGSVVLTYPSYAIANLTVAFSNVAASELGTSAGTELSECQTAFDALNTAITTDLAVDSEDIELASARIAHTKTLIDNYLQRANAWLQQLSIVNDVFKTNAVKNFEKTVQTAQTELALFNEKLGRFQAHVHALISEHKEKLDQYQVQSTFDINVHKENVETWNTVRAANLQKYQADLQKYQADLQAALQGWEGSVQSKFKAAELATQAALTTAQANGNIALQNAANAMQSKLEEYKTLANTAQMLQARFATFFPHYQPKQEQQ